MPEPASAGAVRREPVPFAEVLKDVELNRLNLGIFVLHAVMMSLFVTVPFDMLGVGLDRAEHWKVYAVVMVGSMLFMVPCLRFGETGRRAKTVFLVSIVLVLASQAMLLVLSHSIGGIVLTLLIFFMGFMVLEAALPSQVSRMAPAGARGAAVAVYSTVQFLGAACGSALGGYLMQNAGRAGLLWMNLFMAAVWLAAAWGMPVTVKSTERAFPIPPMDSSRARDLRDRLAGLSGVREVRMNPGTGMAYLKVETRSFDERDVLKLIAGES
jgi:MFS family permease